MSAVVGLTFGFDWKLWIGGVAGVGDVDTIKAREGKLGGSVLVCRTEIVFEFGWYGYSRVHAASIKRGVK